ncbi:hypothetical protein BYT27DRAFT_7197850 [Phlegmacium glaucopus]|nr:hypothetical protein BYT27DRAFT_7197850 [Phlegmacium glaucopus]
MSTTVPRSIIVDDVDSRIQYTGPWFPDEGSQDSVGNYGPPYQSTMHGTKSNASLSFAFNGTQIRVVGSNNIRNDSGVLDPTWQCFIDNISIGASTPFQYPENNWEFCEQNTLLDGPHILTVNATVLKSQTFWIDNIQYVPSASVSLDQAAIVVDSVDPQLQYGQGWQALGGNANMTTVAGSIFTFDFIGVSLSWYGYIPMELPLGSSPATYSIDGQTPINFLLKGIPENTSTTYNQKFFETAQLPAGHHTLKAVYEGNNSTPLTLDYLVIQNGTLASTTTSGSSHATSSSITGDGAGNGTSGASGASTRSTPIGAIAGGVIGGLALTVFIIFGFLLLRRRQKRAAEAIVISSTPQPFNYTPLYPPSTTLNPSSSGGISHSRAPQITHIGNAVTYGTKGHIYGSTPSLSASPDAIAHTTNLRPVPPLHKSPLATINSLLPTLPPVASHLSPLPLPSEINREAEGLAVLGRQRRGDGPPAMVSMQSTDTRSPPNILLHEDSGIRMPPSTPTTMEVPPLYTAD